MDTFSGFSDNIPFVSRTDQVLVYYLLFTTTLLFQLRETRNILIQFVSTLRNNGEEISEKILLKQGYSKLNEDIVRSKIFDVLYDNFPCV